MEELFESVVPALQVDAVDTEEQRVFGGFRAVDAQNPAIPVQDENGAPVEGKAIVLFANGDKYIGSMRGGKKHGDGMYVYADLSAYKGTWNEDTLQGVRHPLPAAQLTVEARKLHDLNHENQQLAEALKQRTNTKPAKAPAFTKV